MNHRTDTFAGRMEENAVEEAAAGLESVEKLIRLLSQTQQQQNQSHSSSVNPNSSTEINSDCRAVADVAVSKFKRVISLLNRTRTGHARFRRAPVTNRPENEKQISVGSRVYCATPIQQIPPHPFSSKIEQKDSVAAINFSYSPAISAANSFISSLTGDTDSKQQPSSSSLKRKCTSSENGGSGKCGGVSGRCHCSKRKKLRLKRVVRVPAISLKLADIPPDDFSWRKYGQKPIKGSPHPRGYYKCSSVRGCPARKHVERAVDDPTMLVVTYEGEHNHALSVAETSNLILESS